MNDIDRDGERGCPDPTGGTPGVEGGFGDVPSGPPAVRAGEPDASARCIDAATVEKFVKKLLPPEEDRSVAVHAERCERCRALLAEGQDEDRIAGLLREAKRELPPELLSRLTSSMTRFQEKRKD